MSSGTDRENISIIAGMNERINNLNTLANALYAHVMDCEDSTDEMLAFTLMIQQELGFLKKLIDEVQP